MTQTSTLHENQQSAFSPLPDELLQQILHYLPPRDLLLNVQLVSKRLQRLGDGFLIWRHYCRVDFDHWDERHHIREKFAGPPGCVDWKNLYLHRKHVDTETVKYMNNILRSRANRIVNFQGIGKFGYDAKDTLLRYCNTSEFDGEHLSEKYYACAVLDFIHRSTAINTWARLKRGDDVPVEKAIGGYDLFILHEHQGDLLEIDDMLDDITTRIRNDSPKFDHMSTRQQSLAIVAFLRQHNFVGIDSEVGYRDMQLTYIGIALHEPEHSSLPLVSVAIFCGVARRLGLDARFCPVPNHVYATVYPKPLIDLDNKLLKLPGSSAQPMYLDPWRSDEEFSPEYLYRNLAQWGIHSGTPEASLARHVADSSDTSNLVLRVSRNIVAAIREFRDERVDGHLRDTRLNDAPFLEMDHAIYSALWANIILPPKPTPRDFNMHQHIPMFLARFERLYPEDVALVEQHVLTLYDSSSVEYSELSDALRLLRAVDSAPRQIRTRSKPPSKDKVKYTVGTVFQHRRYLYNAIIIGWDAECGMDIAWQETHGVTSHVRHQSFYHVLVSDATVRYVAEENIAKAGDSSLSARHLLKVAGQHFERYDQSSGRFVPNFKDEYPDD